MHVEDQDLVATLSQQTEGAPLTAAVYARFETAMSPAHWLGPLGNYLVACPAARAAAHRAEARTDQPLDAAVVLGITAGSCVGTLALGNGAPSSGHERPFGHAGLTPLAQTGRARSVRDRIIG